MSVATRRARMQRYETKWVRFAESELGAVVGIIAFLAALAVFLVVVAP